jgi:hypothetical protein
MLCVMLSVELAYCLSVLRLGFSIYNLCRGLVGGYPCPGWPTRRRRQQLLYCLLPDRCLASRLQFVW